MAVADVVRQKLEEQGLSVFGYHAVPSTGRVVEELREALAGSSVMVMILTSSSSRSPNLAVEIGAAMAWRKSVFVLLQNATAGDLPAFLQDFVAFPISRVDDVVKMVVESIRPLTKDKVDVLKKVYRKVGIPTDLLPIEPVELDKFTREFNRLSGMRLSPERILQELMRLRKSGTLGRLRPVRRLRRKSRISA